MQIAFCLREGANPNLFFDRHVFSRRILAGLLLSACGDALLQWPGYFLHGMGAFGLAQIAYCSAFGFRPLNLPAGAILYTASAIGEKYFILQSLINA